ncbi:hypothetical protein K435DRAFT_740364 [Dendrothele bispora CBS 962.96]|uniref:Uncharacterized protein n=1 Tax=Dendrothele bispora (strain CBS 962.96) TaxID=1314807 RepID=A0A4S8MY17_DENBC|nr:hypothetical protein K435DRAFT_740364 [Dendrothele bispora CBS 962.96]
MSSVHSNNKSFTLDSSGLAGFFGGEEAVSAMTTVHFYEGREWLGWYNSPGSWFVAKQYAKLTRGRFWRGLFPGDEIEPAEIFDLGGKRTPKFIGAISGTKLEETGHLGYLLMNHYGSLKSEWTTAESKANLYNVSVARLKIPSNVSGNASSRYNVEKKNILILFASFVPISTSVGTCIACAVFDDWFAFALIALGIVANGFTCLVIGSGELFVNRANSAPAAPPGDGVLIGKKMVSVVLGDEIAISQVTRGSFNLDFENSVFRRISQRLGLSDYTEVGICCILLAVQFLAQILFVPQATLFGQIMFLSSFAMSWCYNALLSSIEKEKMQRDVFLSEDVLCNKYSEKCVLGSWTAVAVFVILVLKPEKPLLVLDEIIPNKTDVWTAFKDKVVGYLEDIKEGGLEFSDLPEFSFNMAELDGEMTNQQKLIETLEKYANEACTCYRAREWDKRDTVEQRTPQARDSKGKRWSWDWRSTWTSKETYSEVPPPETPV